MYIFIKAVFSSKGVALDEQYWWGRKKTQNIESSNLGGSNNKMQNHRRGSNG